MKNIRTIISATALLWLTIGGTVNADQIPDAVINQLSQLVPSGAPDEISATPIPSLYEARFGTTILYISADGRYLIDGSVLDMQARKNLTEESMQSARADVVNGLNEEEMVVYAPENELRHTLTIFTDIDCPYCVRLHEERQTLLDAGIKLRYLLYPRAGINSPSYEKSVNVWCAEDRAEAMTLAKGGMELEEKNCETPILSQIQLASTFGLKGTPHIVIDTGEVIGGYMPAAKLIEKLGLK